MFFTLLMNIISLNSFSQNIWDGTTDTEWYNTTDTEFSISNAAQLAGLASLVNDETDNFSGKTIKLVSDIWLNEDEYTAATANNWVPIGGNPEANAEFPGLSGDRFFEGTFDGNNRLIYNLYCDKSTGGVYYFQAGLFGAIRGENTTIKNVILIDPYVKAKGMAGSLVGSIGANSDGVDIYIQNCMAINVEIRTSQTSGNDNIGGLLGGLWPNGNNSGTTYVQNCAVTGLIYALNIGGIAGNGNKGYFTDCYFAGTLTGIGLASNIGGIAGAVEAGTREATYTNCYSTRSGGGKNGIYKTEAEMQEEDFISDLNTNGDYYKMDCEVNNGLPLLNIYPCNIKITGHTEICAGTEITLTADLGFDSYVWTNDQDNTESNNRILTVTPNVTTVYTVTGTRNEDDFSLTGEITVNVNENLEINVKIAANSDGQTHGTVNPMNKTIDCDDNSPATFTITPDQGWHISAVYINGEFIRGSDPTDGENVTISYTPEGFYTEISVHFNDSYSVTASMSLNGDDDFINLHLIEPWGTNGIAYGKDGEDMVYTINETAKYHIQDVVVDGESKGPVNSFTFTDLDRDGHTIHVDFFEECGILSLPYFETFDYYGTGQGTFPDCWEKAGTAGIPGVYIYNTPYKSAPGSMGISIEPGSIAIIVLPEFEVENVDIKTLQATFKLYANSTDIQLKVGMIDPSTINQDYKFEELAIIKPDFVNEWDEFEAFFSNYNGDLKNIALILQNPTQSQITQAIYIDDLEIDIAPSCIKPTNLSIENIDGNSVTLSWESDASVDQWEFAIGPKDFTPTSGMMVYNNIQYVKGNLTPLTDYDIYIRAICSGGEPSKWSKVKSFKTTQILAQIPYEFGFEDDFENSNWSLNNGDQTNKWFIGNAVSNGDEGENSLYVSNDNGLSNNYTNNATSYVYAYRSFNIIKKGQYNISYDWMANGEGNYDLLRVFWIPNSVNPNLSGGVDNGMTSTSNTNPSGWISLHEGTKLNLQSSWQNVDLLFDVSETGVYHVVFFWKNDYSQGTNPPAAIDNISFSRVANEFPIAAIDPDNTIRNKQFNMCAGMTLQQVKNTLPQQVPITDTNNRTHNAEIVSWTINGYDPDDTESTFSAKAVFILPDDVTQATTPLDLEVECYVKVNSLPAVTCPTNINATTINNPVNLTGASPVGGTFSGAAVSGNLFNPENLKPADYTITYSYTDENTSCSNSCSFVIKVTYPYVDVIDTEEVFPLTLNSCLGDSERDIKEKLPKSVKIKDSDEIIHTLTLSWSIADYDPQVEGNYTAKGTFNLPINKVAQSEPAKDLWVNASIILNNLPDLTCPDSDIKLMTNESLVLDVATPEGGIYSGDGVINGTFNTYKNINPGTYVITYNYTDPQTACSNYCPFNIIVSQPYIKEVDTDNEAVDIKVCPGTAESVAKNNLVKQIKISDSNDKSYTVNLSWTIDSYNPNNEGKYEATGTFSLPTGVIQSEPETPLKVTVNVEVAELPEVECPEDMNVEPNSITDLAGATPNGGKYSGINVKDGKFDATGLSSGEYTITYTYTDEETGCSNNCSFIITISKVGIEQDNPDKVNIYPNPSNGNFKIDLGIYDGKAYYQIIDPKGSMIMEKILDNQTKELSLDMEAGIYYIKIFMDNNLIVKKLVIE